MDKNLDDEIIDWSLKMVREHPGCFTITTDIAPKNVNDFFGELIIACFGIHDRYVGWHEFEHAKRMHIKNRVGMVVYGLMLYTLKRTGYKVSTGNEVIDNLEHVLYDLPDIDLDCSRWPGVILYCWHDYVNSGKILTLYKRAIEPLIPLVIALSHGWDFQTDADGTDYSIEFYIESAKAFVQEP